MANEEVTTSLNIDITQFKKAMTDANRYIRTANSEFEAASDGTKEWASSTDGLSAKIAQLSKVQEAQKAKVSALQEEYNRVAKEQGENSNAAQEMAIKLNKAKAAVTKTSAEIKEYGEKLDDAKKNTKEATAESGAMATALSNAAKAAGSLATGLAKITGKTIVAGIKSIAAASGTLVTAFLATGEASKEYISAMGKLDAAYSSAGHSADAAAATYSELYNIIGETDQAVEAAQQIALLADSEENAAKWAEQAAAVVGKFGDALQPETFFEAANETIKLGAATGAYTQMLEGCGLDVEKFNETLASCKTEGEKQAYMLEVTQQALAGAGAAYREANAAVIENNKATAALQASMAGVGEAALPVVSSLKLMGASLLDDLMPNIKTFGTSFQEALGGSQTAAQEMGDSVGNMLQALIQKATKALPSVITVGTSIITSLIQGLAQSAPALANGVTQVVQYLIQATPQLLQAGASLISSLVGAVKQNLPQLLTAGGEMLSNLLTGVADNLPAMAQGAMDAIGGFVQGIQTYLPILLSKGAELLGQLGEGIRTGLPQLISQGLDIIMNFVTTLYDAAPVVIDIGINLISNLLQGLLDALPTLISKAPEIVSKFANIINDNAPTLLKKGFELIVQLGKGIISAIPTLIQNIPQIITAIVDVWEAFNWAQLGKKAITFLKDGLLSLLGSVKSAGGKILTAITEGIASLPSKLMNLAKGGVTSLGNALQVGVTTVKTHAKAILTGIVNTLKTLPDKMLAMGKDLVRGLWNGINDMTGWVIGKIQGFGESVLDGIKKFFGIKSPSKVMRDEVGKWLPAGIAEGILGNTGAATKAMTTMARSALSAANAELSGASLNMPGVNGTGANGGGRGGNTYNFYQYNNSPKALSRKDVYRQTKNALKFATSNA